MQKSGGNLPKPQAIGGRKDQRSAGTRWAGAKPKPASGPVQAVTKGNQANKGRKASLPELAEGLAAPNPGMAQPGAALAVQLASGVTGEEEPFVKWTKEVRRT